MRPVYLERHNPSTNIHRFYQIFVSPGVFGDWSVVREWGRCGSPGTVRFDWFDSWDEAITAAQYLYRQKVRKGYQKK